MSAVYYEKRGVSIFNVSPRDPVYLESLLAFDIRFRLGYRKSERERVREKEYRGTKAAGK